MKPPMFLSAIGLVTFTTTAPVPNDDASVRGRATSSEASRIGIAQFHISPREVQVLALLLDGNHLDQTAKQLYITSSTVQDHIKSLMDKTRSRNRSELIARVLGWKSTHERRLASLTHKN